jgi:hypothetical protein
MSVFTVPITIMKEDQDHYASSPAGSFLTQFNGWQRLEQLQHSLANFPAFYNYDNQD